MKKLLTSQVIFSEIISWSFYFSETFEGSSGKVTVDNGQVGIGEITGGSFGPGSFSIAGPGGVTHGLPAGAVQHGGPIIINPPQGGVHQGNVPPQNGEAKPKNSGGNPLVNFFSKCVILIVALIAVI